MKIAVCTAVWRRPRVTRFFYEWTRHVAHWWAPHEVQVIAAGSESGHVHLAREYGVTYCDAPNEPLGAKFNATLSAARGADLVLIMGSDDVFDERIASAYQPYMSPTAYVGLQDFWFYELRHRQLGYWPGYSRQARWLEPAGSGRLMGRDLLDLLEWQLWDPSAHRGMDHSAFRRLQEYGVAHPALLNARALGGLALAIKSDTNIWKYSQIAPRPEPDHGVMERLPTPLRHTLEEMHGAVLAV